MLIMLSSCLLTTSCHSYQQILLEIKKCMPQVHQGNLVNPRHARSWGNWSTAAAAACRCCFAAESCPIPRNHAPRAAPPKARRSRDLDIEGKTRRHLDIPVSKLTAARGTHTFSGARVRRLSHEFMANPSDMPGTDMMMGKDIMSKHGVVMS